MIFYTGYYDEMPNPERRLIALSAVNKMSYIISEVAKANYPLTVVSFSETMDKSGYPGIERSLSENVKLVKFHTFGRKNIFTKLLDRYGMKLQGFFYLLKNIKHGDAIFAYHNTSYCRWIALLKKIKKCKLILEVEEIYSDVSGDSQLRKRENVIFRAADAFVFPTGLLNQAINPDKKPYIVIHGTYQVEPALIEKAEYRKMHGWDENRCHVVYAGTLDPRKGGAVAAVSAALYLKEDYHIHILGFGSDADVQHMKQLVSEISESSECAVTYDGVLSGKEYLQFIQNCDIGLSTQNPEGIYNATSFPSKVLSYMANGLRVVSIDIPAIRESAIGSYLYYYQIQSPENIAKTITQVNMNDCYDGRKVVSDLSRCFGEELQSLLKGLENA